MQRAVLHKPKPTNAYHAETLNDTNGTQVLWLIVFLVNICRKVQKAKIWIRFGLTCLTHGIALTSLVFNSVPVSPLRHSAPSLISTKTGPSCSFKYKQNEVTLQIKISHIDQDCQNIVNPLDKQPDD